MAPKTKYTAVADLLKQRIRQGDYDNSILPGALKLAAEMGVSYMTARQAVASLVDTGLVRRADNGRLEIPKPEAATGRFKLAYVNRIDIASHNLWRQAILRAAGHYDCQLREFSCDRETAPAVFEVLDGDYDLIFLQLGPFKNPLLLDKLLRAKDRVVTLFHDLTEYGIRCFEGPSPDSIGRLIRHLYELGHRRIDCFFADDSPIRLSQIDVWRRALAELGCSGRLQPHLTAEESYERAYRTTCKLLETGRFNSTAIFCPVTFDAVQVIRALYEHGIRVPEDVSIVGFGEKLVARMSIPAITVICPEDIELTALEILEHFMKVHEQPEKLMFRTRGAEAILYGESTGQVKEA